MELVGGPFIRDFRCESPVIDDVDSHAVGVDERAVIKNRVERDGFKVGVREVDSVSDNVYVSRDCEEGGVFEGQSSLREVLSGVVKVKTWSASRALQTAVDETEEFVALNITVGHLRDLTSRWFFNDLRKRAIDAAFALLEGIEDLAGLHENLVIGFALRLLREEQEF